MSITDEQYARAKSERRRRLQQRQTLVFGSLVLLLALALLIAWLQWARIIPSPFAREFTTEDVPRISETLACPTADSVFVTAPEITTAVLNSTPTGGLAGEVRDVLTGMGVVVDEVGNWEDGVVASAGVIEVGPSYIAQGYSLQVLLPGFPVMLSDDPETDVIAYIGAQYTAPGDPALLVAGQPIPIPAECAAVAPSDAPADVPPEEPPAEEAPAEEAPAEEAPPEEAPAEEAPAEESPAA